MTEDIANHPLYPEAVRLQKSVTWWRTETSAAIDEATLLDEKIESGTASVGEKKRAEELKPRLKYLLGKGEFEQKSLDAFEDKLNEYEARKAFLDSHKSD